MQQTHRLKLIILQVLYLTETISNGSLLMEMDWLNINPQIELINTQ